MKKIINILILTFLLVSFNSHAESLELSGSSYILMDEVSGRVLVDKKAHNKMPMASTTKIMTALIAIEEGNILKDIKIDSHSTDIEGSSIYLEKDEVISLKDLLYGLMLRSGNDSAVAIARAVGLNEENFVAKMNRKSQDINAINTNFTDPHGLGSDNHYSTSYDLALITREALKHKEFQEIFSTKEYRANREKNNYFINKNKTLWEYDGGDGGKTGYTMTSGRCLVSTASRNGLRLIAVSLNARDWFNDNYKLLDYGFENYKPYIVYSKNQKIKSLAIKNGSEDLIVMTDSELFYPLNDGEKNKIKNIVEINKELKAPIEKGDQIGYIKTYLNGLLINNGRLVAKNTVNKISFINKLLKGVEE